MSDVVGNLEDTFSREKVPISIHYCFNNIKYFHYFASVRPPCLKLRMPKSIVAAPFGRVGKVAEYQRSLSFDHLTAVAGVGSSPALATCETSQVLLAGVSGGFPGVLPFRPTHQLARLDMSEIILKGTLN